MRGDDEHVVYVVARDARPEAPDDIVRMILERNEHVIEVERTVEFVTPVRVRAADVGEARGIVAGAVARANPDAYRQFTFRHDRP